MLYWGGNSPCSRHSMLSQFFSFLKILNTGNFQTPSHSLAEHSSALSHITAMSARRQSPEGLLQHRIILNLLLLGIPQVATGTPSQVPGQKIQGVTRVLLSWARLCHGHVWCVTNAISSLPMATTQEQENSQEFYSERMNPCFGSGCTAAPELGWAALAPPVPLPPMWFQLKTSSIHSFNPHRTESEPRQEVLSLQMSHLV